MRDLIYFAGTNYFWRSRLMVSRFSFVTFFVFLCFAKEKTFGWQERIDLSFHLHPLISLACVSVLSLFALSIRKKKVLFFKPVSSRFVDFLFVVFRLCWFPCCCFSSVVFLSCWFSPRSCSVVHFLVLFFVVVFRVFLFWDVLCFPGFVCEDAEDRVILEPVDGGVPHLRLHTMQLPSLPSADHGVDLSSPGFSPPGDFKVFSFSLPRPLGGARLSPWPSFAGRKSSPFLVWISGAPTTLRCTDFVVFRVLYLLFFFFLYLLFFLLPFCWVSSSVLYAADYLLIVDFLSLFSRGCWFSVSVFLRFALLSKRKSTPFLFPFLHEFGKEMS